MQCDIAVDGCWDWTGHLHDGYGKMNFNGKKERVHRVAWQLRHCQAIPNGMVIRHTCDNRACVNPDHLRLGTQSDNIRDRNIRGRTARGEAASNSKLTKCQVDEIRKKYRPREVTYQQLADEYGICLRQAWMIVTGRSWSVDFDFEEKPLGNRTLELPISRSVVFDIETSPVWEPGDSVEAAQEYCRPLGIDFDPASIGEHPGEFNPDEVKLGNLRDQAKIEAKIETARQKHEADVAKFELDTEAKELAFWQSVIDNAALSPVTGCVLAIGYLTDGQIIIDDSEDEMSLLSTFWKQFQHSRSSGDVLTGWNISGFDVPFVMCRSARFEVGIPKGLFARGKWLSDTFVDCMQLWGKQYNPWRQQYSNAGAKQVARFLGCCTREEGGMEGKDFWKHFLGTKEQREEAIEYLTHDVEEEAFIARAMHVI